MAQIDKLKVRLGITDATQDALLAQLLEDAEAQILDYTNRKVMIDKMLGLQRELAVIYHIRNGAEGISSHSQGGVSISYTADNTIPETIKSRLKAYVRLKVSVYAT